MADVVRVTEKTDFAVATVLARRGVGAAAIGEALAVDLPPGPGWAARGPIVAIGAGPGTWLVQREGFDPDWIGQARGRLTGLASLSDQSAAYRIFRIEGPGARTLLQRGVAIDLDGAAFAARSAAVTAIAHLDVVVRCLQDGGYELAVYRSSAETFRRWLEGAIDGL